MGPKQRREREKETLRQEILDAARDLFVKEGYENVSMRRIAEKIEYSPTTIYLYFEDKASLLFAICDETFAKLAKRMESIVKGSDDPVEALKRVCRAYVEFGLKYPNHYHVTFINHPRLHLGPDHYLRDGSMGMKAYNCLRAGVEECIKQKRFRQSDVDTVTQMMWAGGHGLTSLLITKPHFPWADRNQLIDIMIDTLVEGLKA
ncbi:MAG TPA: TetR/AcrR family transcriptional regulator [Blastocatellia bacterium]|jgi:AcrR family transcriptional regulator|nr:TetR/AcrR family transcriptional regulator [Blastocatellia bacterium]